MQMISTFLFEEIAFLLDSKYIPALANVTWMSA